MRAHYTPYKKTLKGKSGQKKRGPPKKNLQVLKKKKKKKKKKHVAYFSNPGKTKFVVNHFILDALHDTRMSLDVTLLASPRSTLISS